VLGAYHHHGLHSFFRSCRTWANLLRHHCSDPTPHQQRAQPIAVFGLFRVHVERWQAWISNNPKKVVRLDRKRTILLRRAA